MNHTKSSYRLECADDGYGNLCFYLDAESAGQLGIALAANGSKVRKNAIYIGRQRNNPRPGELFDD